MAPNPAVNRTLRDKAAQRRTTTRIKPTSGEKAFGFSVLAAYPPPRWVLEKPAHS